MKKSVIFDLDGTLWDTTEQIKKVWKHIAKNYKLMLDDKNIKEIMGLTKNEIIHHWFNNNFKLGYQFITDCQEQENIYLSQYGGNIYTNTIDTLKELYENNYKLYIVSNCQIGYIESFLTYYNLKKYIKDYECSGKTGKDKEENIRKIIKRNNITDAVYVGDTESDYIATKNNGLPFIWVEYGFGQCYKADESIKDIKNLKDKLEKM